MRAAQAPGPRDDTGHPYGDVLPVIPHLAEHHDGARLEAEFIRAAGPYSQRKGITYDARRAAGAQPRVLKAAGVGRAQ